MRYLVRFFDPSRAKVVEVEAEGHSISAIREEWCISPRVMLAIQPLRARPAARSRDFDAAWWCHELKTLLTAGMSVVECIDTLHDKARGGPRHRVHARLLEGLREGLPLSRAMQRVGVFPPVLLAGVAASERTSTLVAALDDYLRYEELLVRLRKQAASAAIYPAIVVSLGTLIALFLLMYVMPRFSRMYVDFHGSVSTATQVLLWLSRTLAEQAHWVGLGAAALAAGAAWLWRRGLVASAASAFVEAVGPLRRQLDHFRLAKLYHSLALMFRGGYSLDEALRVCEGLGLGTRVTNSLRLARLDISRGRPVSAAFEQAGLTETVSQRLLSVGERTGGFDAVLRTIAERHAQAFTTAVERATRIVEPVLLLVVALVVGGIVVMMYMPVFDIANGIR